MENYNPEEIARRIMETLQKEYKELTKLNIMVLGKTGVGKSTLINHMFSEKLAETGIGKPVTSAIRKIEKPDFPLAIYDTPGLELSGDNAAAKLSSEVCAEIQKSVKCGDISKAIHCILYCVSTTSHRFENAEVEFLKKLLDEVEDCNVPVIVVLTQSYVKKDAEALKAEIEKENLSVVNIMPVLAENCEITEDYTIPAYGLDQLTEIMYNVIPEAVRKTFITIQCANLDLKQKKAHAAVATAGVSAAAIGAVPIPFSDAGLLIPTQITMLVGITAAFGIPIDKASLLASISATIGTAGTTVLGKTLVSGLLKFIPGAGCVIGGGIAAGTAAALTAALGETYILILTKVCKGEMNLSDLGTAVGKAEIVRTFQELLKVKRDKNGAPAE